MFDNVSFFEWLGFFFGGAFGSLVILGIQSLVTSISTKRKYKDEKAKVTQAVIEELKTALTECKGNLVILNQHPKGLHTFARFNYTWLDVYLSRFLDLRIVRDSEVHKDLDIIRKKMLLIQDIEHDQHMLSTTSRALSTIDEVLADYNVRIEKHTGELIQIIEAVLPLFSPPPK